MFRKNILALSLLFSFFISLNSQASDTIHLISVNGLAEVNVDPNMLVLQIESWGKAASAKAAQETQAKQYTQIKSVADRFKIAKEDFKTENYAVNPDYLWDQKTQRNKVIGYRASHQITITFRKIEDAGSLIDALTAAGKDDSTGGVSILNTTWDSDKKSVVETSAINQAVRDARSQAEELAKAAGVKIKAVHRIAHTSTSAGPPMALHFSRQKAMVSDAASTELSSGQIKIRVEVQMEFEI